MSLIHEIGGVRETFKQACRTAILLDPHRLLAEQERSYVGSKSGLYAHFASCCFFLLHSKRPRKAKFRKRSPYIIHLPVLVSTTVYKRERSLANISGGFEPSQVASAARGTVGTRRGEVNHA